MRRPVRSAACPSRVDRPTTAAPDQAGPPASPRSSRTWARTYRPPGAAPSPRRPPYSADDPHAPWKVPRMLVLHGFWSLEGGLCVWAEDSDRAVTSRSQALRSARPHPFAAPVDVLADACSGKAGEATLRLPSLAKSPLDSPELIRGTPRAARAEAGLVWGRGPRGRG